MDKIEAFKMYLKPGFAEEYKARHSALWPEVKAILKKNGVSDYAIFLDEETNTLFAFQHTTGKGSQAAGDEEAIKRWWHYMKDIMLTNEDESPVSVPLKEMFYLP
jgi:L-rhamnose 1-epimerase